MPFIPERPAGESVTRQESAAKQEFAGKILAVQFERLREFENRDAAGYFNVDDGSPLAIDDLWAYPQRLSGTVRLSINAALDHLRTIRLLVEGDLVPWIAIFTLMRSAIETASIAIYLLEPNDRDTRLLRLLQQEWAEISDAEKMMANAGKAIDPPRPEREALVRRPLERRPTIGTLAAVKTKPTITDKITAAQRIVNTQIPHEGRPSGWVLSLWQGFSGLTHGRSYAAQVILDREELGYDPDTGAVDVHLTTGLSSIAGTLQVALDVVDTALRLFGTRKVNWQSTVDDLTDLEQIIEIRAASDPAAEETAQ